MCLSLLTAFASRVSSSLPLGPREEPAASHGRKSLFHRRQLSFVGRGALPGPPRGPGAKLPGQEEGGTTRWSLRSLNSHAVPRP